ncbi:MAG: hypothetical protein GQ570_12070 [Helicobacteraceae bacterium]|nr:hypothetical protein [Helicobacteraceae bacterium]
MATSSTIHKINLNIADMDRNYYAENALTLAKHPSENELRLMVRLVAYVLNANESLLFTKGIAQEDEPDLWQKSLGGDSELWIILGQPDEKRIKKACGKSSKVILYMYQDGSSSAWFKQMQKVLKRFSNLSIIYLNIEGNIEQLVKRGMDLQANLCDHELTLIEGEESVLIKQEIWK